MEGVSVVVASFNNARYLPACLESILSQGYPGPLEVLVGEDGSTDTSLDIARSYGSPVRVLQHPNGANRGVTATRNLCLRQAAHPLIAFLDSDDLYLPGHLTGLVTALTEHPEAGLAYNNGAYLLSDGRVLGTRFPEDHRTITAEQLLLDCVLATNGILVRRSALEVVGLFEESLPMAEDHDLWLRLLERYPAVFVPAKGWLYRRHGSSQLTSHPRLWNYAQRTLDRARARGRYPEPLLRKRQAVIDYRLGVAALSERRFLHASWHFGRAAWFDPMRSVRVALTWLGR